MFSIACYVVAGFLLYTVALIGFVLMPGTPIKLGIMLGFSLPAVIALLVGFAIDSFRHKARDTGIVLLSVAGFEALSILTWVCILSSDETRRMMPPGLAGMYSDYGIGFGFLAALIALGLSALLNGLRRQGGPPELPPSPVAPAAGS